MWFLLLYLQISAIQGLNVTLRGSDSPCKGRLEVYHNRKWGLVCHYGWKKENGEVVCRSLGCGDHVYSDVERTLYKDPPPPQQYWMEQVNCTSKEETLWRCSYVNIDTTKCDKDSFVAVECSGNVKLSLNLNGHRGTCAGVVEFSTPDGVFEVCNNKGANKICQELGCGDHYSISKPGVFREGQSKQSVSLNCLGNEQYSWQCMERSECQERVSVICSNHTLFRLRNGSNACSGLVEKYKLSVKPNSWKPLQETKMSPEVICAQMNCGPTGNFTNVNGTNTLTCSDSVKLNNFTAKCFGDVSINVNGSNYEVCYSESHSIESRKKMGAVICRELGCGDMVHVQKGSPSTQDTLGFLSDVECQGDEPLLWHCLAVRGKKQCSGTKVICSDSLDVRLSDGLGRCSGRVEVKWEGSWRPVGSEKNNENLNVCGRLNCGTHSQTNRELFFEVKQQSSEWLWNVKCENFSVECFESAVLRRPHGNEKNIEIICQKEELQFFEGNSPCKGKVYTERFDGETRWLPAKLVKENKKNASDICLAMKCGTLVSFETEQNTTLASITCSGSRSMALENRLGEKCWGTVRVCGDKECGGVCEKTWRNKEDSEMICRNLGCGKPIQANLKFQTELSLTYHSVYCSKKAQNMNMCNFIPKNNSVCKSVAKVICTDSVKAKLEDPRDRCAGKVSLFYAGEWTPVCQDSLDTNLKNTVCKELLCGESINDQNNWTLHEESTSTGLSKITCQDSDDSVSKCDLSKVSKNKCTVGYLKCKDWERLLLYKKKGECSGPVYCLQGGKTHQVSGIGWSQEEGQKLCEYLQCGNYISHSPMLKDMWWNKTYNFSGKNKTWECKSHDQPIQNQSQLNIQCDRKPNIKLSNNCKGNLLIDNEHVCASQWEDEMSHKLCDSLKCGKAFRSWSTDSQTKNLLHFGCTGEETLVWQCGFKNGTCKKALSVACTDGVEFSTTEKCGGKIGIRYNEKWVYVCGELTKDDTKKFCDALNCNDNQELLDEQKIAKQIYVKIDCLPNYYNIFHCMHLLEGKICSHGLAEIKCEGYIPEDNSSVGLILGLLGGVLGLLILFLIWTNRKRLLLALRRCRNKNHKEVNPNVNEMNKMDIKDKDLSEGKAPFLEDDYEDLGSLVEESEEEENEDDRKRGSSGTEYDDIEGQANGISTSQTHHDDDLNLPLLPRRPENILDQDTYEVEKEKQEDYDDVIPVETAANENAGTAGTQEHVDEDEGADSDLVAGLVENADTVLVTTEAEIHTQPE